MSAQPLLSDSQRAQIALYGDPYLFLELEEAEVEHAQILKRILAEFHNPYLFEDVVAASEDSSAPIGAATAPDDDLLGDHSKGLANSLDEVLRLYQPFMARNQWVEVKEYRAEFLREASRDPNQLRKVLDGLRGLKFQLMPGEKVECNRAPAQRIIAELKRLLS